MPSRIAVIALLSSLPITIEGYHIEIYLVEASSFANWSGHLSIPAALCTFLRRSIYSRTHLIVADPVRKRQL